MHPNVHSSTIYNSQDMEATPKCPSTDEWIKTMWHIHTNTNTHTHIHTHTGIFLSHKKWNNAIDSNMGGPRDYHIKWSKSERERQIPYDITYMWNLKYDTNEPIYESETESRA